MAISISSVSVSDDTRRYLAFGDSITAGSGGVQSWTTLVHPLITNRAVGGHTIWQVQREVWNVQGGIYYPAYSAIRDRNGYPAPDKVIIMAGVNDLLAGATVASMQTMTLALVAELEVWGCAYQFITVLPTDNSSVNDTNRQTYNTWLKSTYANTIDADPTMGEGSPYTLKDAYHIDGTHLNLTGAKALAALVQSEFFA